MKVFIAYRHTGADLAVASRALESIRAALQARGIGSYCTLLDGPDCMSAKTSLEVLQAGVAGLERSDALLLFVDSEALSAGMYIEAGYALAKALPVYLLLREGIGPPYLADLATKTCHFAAYTDIPAAATTLFN